MFSIVIDIIRESWLVLGAMAPYLWLGFLVAGALSVWVSPEWLERHLGGSGMGPVFKASLFGVPLPLCSCGVIPVAASLSRHGASRGATTAFLLSTPQTGVDSILVTQAMLGPLFAVYRPVAALLTGVIGGGLVRSFGEATAPGGNVTQSEGASCSEDCCAGGPETSSWRRALRYGLVTLPKDIGVALLVGVLIAGALAALVPADSLEAYLGGGVLSILLLMAAGVPLYVCATASVPIAAGFIHLGASPGAALAFLIAGPATNAATLTTVMKVMGRRTAFLYLATVALSAFGGGVLLNWLAPRAAAAIPQLAISLHSHSEPGWLTHLAAVTLLALLVYSLLSGRLTARKQYAAAEALVTTAPAESRLELAVSGMNCSHCSESVQRAIAECVGVQSVAVNLDSGRAVVIGRDLVPQALVVAVSGLGYTASLVSSSPADG